MHKSWATYFKGLDNGLPSEQAFRPPPAAGAGGAAGFAGVPSAADGAPSLHLGDASSELTDHLKVSTPKTNLLPSPRSRRPTPRV